MSLTPATRILADPLAPTTALASTSHTLAVPILADPAPFTALAPDSISPNHPVAPISADPAVPTKLSTGTQPSKCKATNIETSDLAMVHANQRQKKGGAVVVSTENSQPIEEGREALNRIAKSKI